MGGSLARTDPELVWAIQHAVLHWNPFTACKEMLLLIKRIPDSPIPLEVWAYGFVAALVPLRRSLRLRLMHWVTRIWGPAIEDKLEQEEPRVPPASMS